MKFIVTGGAGFIGKALCRTLRNRGADVISIDRKNGIEADDIESYLNEGGVDGVFHLAAQTSVFNNDIEQIKRDNIDTFIRVCDACKKAKVKLVYASSSTADPNNTTSMYGITKYFDERYAMSYYRKATGVRLHNVYGPNPRKGTLLYNLISGEKVRLYNKGKNVRHFTYIRDAIEGLIYAYNSHEQLLNVACPLAMEVKDFAALVAKYVKQDIEISAEVRTYDNYEQRVNNEIANVPMYYKLPSEGIESIFE